MPFTVDKKTGDKVWTPNDKQKAFLSLPDQIFEALYGGAAGGGKSELLLLLPILRGFHTNSSFKGAIFRQTFPQLEESLIPRSREYYELVGGKYNNTKHQWDFFNPDKTRGGVIKFDFMEVDDDARKHDTAEYNYLAFDELTAFSEFMYTYMTSRVRSSDPNLPAIVRSASNPGNKGHSWVRKRFVEPYKFGGKIIKEVAKDGAVIKRIFISAKLSDNTWLKETDPDYEARLHNLPEADRKAKVDGDWWAFTGQVFLEFRANRLPNEPENALHVIEPFEIPAYWPRILAVDWGFTAMTYALWLAVAPDGRIFAYREYYSTKKTVEEWCADLKRWSQYERIEMCFIDPSAKQNRGDVKSIYERFIENTDFYTLVADNDRVSGKMLIHDFLRWKPKPPRYIPKDGYNREYRDSLFRIRGLAAAKAYENMFLPDPPETNLPRLQIFKDCKKLIEVIPSCTYDEKKKEDVADFDGDDPYDALRYGLKGVDFYVRVAQNELSERQKIADAVAELQRTGDQTDYHRRMEHLEASHSAVLVGRHRKR